MGDNFLNVALPVSYTGTTGIMVWYGRTAQLGGFHGPNVRYRHSGTGILVPLGALASRCMVQHFCHAWRAPEAGTHVLVEAHLKTLRQASAYIYRGAVLFCWSPIVQ